MPITVRVYDDDYDSVINDVFKDDDDDDDATETSPMCGCISRTKSTSTV